MARLAWRVDYHNLLQDQSLLSCIIILLCCPKVTFDLFAEPLTQKTFIAKYLDKKTSLHAYFDKDASLSRQEWLEISSGCQNLSYLEA